MKIYIENEGKAIIIPKMTRNRRMGHCPCNPLVTRIRIMTNNNHTYSENGKEF